MADGAAVVVVGAVVVGAVVVGATVAVVEIVVVDTAVVVVVTTAAVVVELAGRSLAISALGLPQPKSSSPPAAATVKTNRLLANS